jgi:hypothetical protein
MIGILFILLVVIIFASSYSWLPFKRALEESRYATAWRVVIFIITFIILSFITLFILANSIYLER